MISANINLVDLLENCDAEYTRFRLENMKNIKNNPLEIDIFSVNNMVAFKITKWPKYWYGNKVLLIKNYNSFNESDFKKINEFFTKSSISYRIEIPPLHTHPHLSQLIRSNNFLCIGFDTVLIKHIETPLNNISSNNINIRRITTRDNVDKYLDVYQDGFGYKRFTQEEKTFTKAWCNTDNSNLYLYGAYHDDNLVGVAIMFINKNVAIMADASTLPNYRGKGIQKLLIQQRLIDAHDQRCDFATSYVEFGSVSHNNLLKMGFSTFYTKVVFSK